MESIREAIDIVEVIRSESARRARFNGEALVFGGISQGETTLYAVVDGGTILEPTCTLFVASSEPDMRLLLDSAGVPYKTRK